MFYQLVDKLLSFLVYPEAIACLAPAFKALAEVRGVDLSAGINDLENARRWNIILSLSHERLETLTPGALMDDSLVIIWASR